MWYTVRINLPCGKHLGVRVLLVTMALRPKSEAERQNCSQPRRDVALWEVQREQFGQGNSILLYSVGSKPRKSCHCLLSSQKHSAAEFLMEGREDRLFLLQPLLSSEVFSQVSITFCTCRTLPSAFISVRLLQFFPSAFMETVLCDPYAVT